MFNKNNDKSWQKKAKIKSLEIKNLKKDVRDIQESRDSWKNKALKFQERIKYLENELKKTKFGNERPKRYWFSLASIMIILKTKLNSSTSFRAVVMSFMIMNESLKLSKKKISHTTGLNWIHKIGYYELTKEKEILFFVLYFGMVHHLVTVSGNSSQGCYKKYMNISIIYFSGTGNTE